MSYIRADWDIPASLLCCLRNLKSLSAGQQMHDHIIRNGPAPYVRLENSLVQMYRNCGALDEARAVFKLMHKRNLFSWNIMIGGYVENGESKEALELFQHMNLEGVEPDEFTFSAILSACTSQFALSVGECIHHNVVDCGLESHVVVGTALLDMYGKCGSLEHARRTFNEMPNRNIFSWNAMLAAYAQHDQLNELLQLLNQMQQESVSSDKVTYITVITACANKGELVAGRRLHASVVGCMFEPDIVLQNALLNLYGKCGCKKDTEKIFNKISNRNFVAWNAMIAASAQLEQVNEALELFSQMQLEGLLPDGFTYSSLLSACTSKVVLSEGERMHARVAGSAYEADIVVATALITMYGKCGTVAHAWRVFEKTMKGNVAVWNAMITAYAQQGKTDEAVKMFQKLLQKKLIPDRVSLATVLSLCADQGNFVQGKLIHDHIRSSGVVIEKVVNNSLINMYAKCGDADTARKIFNTMLDPDLVSWTAVIGAYTQSGQVREALQLYEQMLFSEVEPDEVILLNILAACADEATLIYGKQMHHCILSCAFQMDDTLQTALVNMYSKCGSLKDAQNVFDRTKNRTVVTWNSMIGVYAQHGLGKEAFSLFDQMQHEKVVPDEITFFSVLSACSHTGLLHEGQQYFASMIRDYGIAPKVEHFNCFIDLLGRAGQLEKMEELIRDMPLHPNSASWTSMLGSCKVHADMKRGRDAATQVFNLDHTNASPYVLLANVCAAAGDSG